MSNDDVASAPPRTLGSQQDHVLELAMTMQHELQLLTRTVRAAIQDASHQSVTDEHVTVPLPGTLTDESRVSCAVVDRAPLKPGVGAIDGRRKLSIKQELDSSIPGPDIRQFSGCVEDRGALGQDGSHDAISAVEERLSKLVAQCRVFRCSQLDGMNEHLQNARYACYLVQHPS